MDTLFEVQHEQGNNQFVIKLEGADAVLQYLPRGKTMDMTYTYVPVAYRGKGLADKLCQAAFEYAKQNSLTVIPSCPYIGLTYLRRHPEYHALVEKVLE